MGCKESDTTERLNNNDSNNLCKMAHPILATPFIIQKMNLTRAVAGWYDPSGKVQIARGGE